MPSGVYQHKKGYTRSPRTAEWSKKLGIVHKGKRISEEQKQMISKKLKGRKVTWGYKISVAHKGTKKPWSKPPVRRGSDHYNWKGGRTSLKERIRASQFYKNWRIAIFIRDNFQCVICKTGRFIEADHHPFSFQDILDRHSFKTPEDSFGCQELWDTNNGRTLCKECHKKTSNYLWKSSPQNKK